MKLIYISYDVDGYLCLKEILHVGGNVAAIFTLRDDLMREMVHYRAFDDIAREYDIPLYKVKNIDDPANIAIMERIKPDLIFVLGWSQVITKKILDIPTNGCIGVHPTLLPKNRGRAPIPWAVIKGLKKSGVTLFYLDEGVDSGDIIVQKEFEIGFTDNVQTITDKVTNLQVELIREVFPLLKKNEAPRIPQDHSKANYWPRRKPEDGIIDWNKSNWQLYNWVRGLTHPYPGAFTYYTGKKLFIWEATLLRTSKRVIPGEFLELRDKGIVVGTGKGCSLIRRVQFEGEQECIVSKQFLADHGMKEGCLLGKT